jgi:hypothetical protein
MLIATRFMLITLDVEVLFINSYQLAGVETSLPKAFGIEVTVE